ncbi:MAG: DUF4430 domain-containing protein [Promethearchaeota archaeon]
MNKVQILVIILSILIPSLLIGAFVVYKQWTAIPEGWARNITLQIKYNETITETYYDMMGPTPFHVLNQCASVTYHYDSGFLFVDKVNNIADGFWLYYVNNESGMVSSDLHQLNDSDIVRWEQWIM